MPQQSDIRDEDKTREQLLAELKGLRISEQRFRMVADSASDWEYIVAPDSSVEYVSPSVERITGFAPAAFYADPNLIESVVHPDEREALANHNAQLRSVPGSACPGLRFRIVTKDGSVRWIEHDCQQVIHADGVAAGWRVSNRDITARRELEEALNLAKQQLRAILEASVESVFLMDAQGKVLAANQTTLERLHADERAVSERPLYDLLPPDVAELRRGIVKQVMETGSPALFADQRFGRTILNSIYPVKSEGRSLEQVAVFGMDITDERLAGEEIERGRRELSEASLLLQLVIDTIPVRIFWKDRDSRYLGCNRRFALDAGRTCAAELVGETDFNMAWKDQADAYRADDRDVVENNRSKINYEEMQTTPSGTRIWLLTTKVPLIGLDGNVIGILGTYDDITARKEMEERLRDSEERYRNQFHNNHAVQLIIQPETGRVIDANPAACRYYGYALDVLKTKNISEINVLPNEQVFEEMARAKAEQRNYFQFQHRLASGEIRAVEVYSGPVQVKNQQLLYSIIHDISDRKKAEEERERLIVELRDALSRIKTLSGLLPICAACKKIRNDQGYWEQLECYIRDHTDADFTHGICPSCVRELYPELGDSGERA